MRCSFTTLSEGTRNDSRDRWKEGTKNNFELYVLIKGVKVHNLEAQLTLFESFLRYLATLPLQMVKANKQTLGELCAEIFSQPRFLEVLSQLFVYPGLPASSGITQLSCCPMGVSITPTCTKSSGIRRVSSDQNCHYN
jgi:hypothetical protein